MAHLRGHRKLEVLIYSCFFAHDYDFHSICFSRQSTGVCASRSGFCISGSRHTWVKMLCSTIKWAGSLGPKALCARIAHTLRLEHGRSILIASGSAMNSGCAGVFSRSFAGYCHINI
ncbi:hypothetical protein BKA67DRAFT_585122 [Truncatella angustata]|uniref:Uncharacterized protein n=1 Tax=Truncatella angustata TaxID=152316 RepID=A0A9P8RGC5_9PEZI|nr:uncharacterized protein BKA67DRAFT_585122 [Truncatella angustata]KAH6645468.1 hypothetical protein BKA67DRAFT_585122 [Truncatella angustata]